MHAEVSTDDGFGIARCVAHIGDTTSCCHASRGAVPTPRNSAAVDVRSSRRVAHAARRPTLARFRRRFQLRQGHVGPGLQRHAAQMMHIALRERDFDGDIHRSVVDSQRKRATDGKPVSVVVRPDPQHEIERAVAEARQYCTWLVLSMPAVRWRASRGSAPSPDVQARFHLGVSAMRHGLRRIPDRWLKRHCTSTS